MNKDQIQQEIARLTEELREKKPTVYKHLMENPFTLESSDDLKFLEALGKYKENLIQLLRS